MNILIKRMSRGRIWSFILIIILSCSLTIGAIGLGSTEGVRRQIKDIDKDYTTIAVPDGGGDFEFQMYDMIYGVERDNESIFEKDNKLKSCIIKEDRRSYFTAYTPQCTSVTPYESEDYTSYVYNGKNNNLVVAAVECERVDAQVEEATRFDECDGEMKPEVIKKITYNAYFKLDEMECCSDGLKTFQNIYGFKLMNGAICNEDGSIPFETGKKYLLFGLLSGQPWDWNVNAKYTFPNPFYLIMENGKYDQITSTMDMENKDGVHYDVVTDELFPLYSEYQGNVEDFIKSEEGKIWSEQVIPYCEMNYKSASIIATEDLDSMYSFNTGIASVIEGRKFQDTEYEIGEKVCLVSSAYAQKNNLCVGDTIQMDLHKGTLMEECVGIDESLSDTDAELETQYKYQYGQCILGKDNGMGVIDDWKIVGIYTAPEHTDKSYNFSANTILVPKKSVPNASEYEEVFPSVLYSIVLKNGTEKQFAEELSKYSGGDQFLYANQGYDAVKESFRAIMKTVRRLCMACIAGAFMGVLLFLFLCWKRVFGTMMKMRLLGVSKRKAFTQFIISMLPMTGIATIVGIGLGAALCEVVLRTLIKVKIPIQLSAIVGAVAVECMVALLLLSIIGVLMLSHRLISRKM